MKKAKFLNLNLKDVLKSLVVFFFTTVISGVYALIQAGGDLNWVNIKGVLIAAGSATIAYLLKNFFTNSEDKILTREPKTF